MACKEFFLMRTLMLFMFIVSPIIYNWLLSLLLLLLAHIFLIFFEYVSLIVTTTTSSCKKMEVLLEESHKELLDGLERGEVSTGRGLNKPTNLARPRDTRWGSHHKTLIRLDGMWASVIKVLSTVDANGHNSSHVVGCVEKMQCFAFALVLKLMIKLLGITNELSRLLQKKI
jgi:hypothetical protein